MYVYICIIQSLLISKVDITYITVFTNSKGMEIEEWCEHVGVIITPIYFIEKLLRKVFKERENT